MIFTQDTLLIYVTGKPFHLVHIGAHNSFAQKKKQSNYISTLFRFGASLEYVMQGICFLNIVSIKAARKKVAI